MSSPAHDTTTDPLIGRTLAGKYVIRRIIARGGVGVVYLASRVGDGANVVVKFLAENWVDNSEAVARFEREARRLNSLRHPNIVAMLDHGQADGRAFLVMEYVPGELLGHYVVRHGKLSVEQFVPIAAQILKGLGDAHSREMMIRDIKASNIMLCDYKGRGNFVKILDFGLAKGLRGETPITEEHVLGTVGYMAPEALQGQVADLRVDVYAIGVLFYYMLSGVMPFEGDNNATVFYKTINERPRHLAELLPPGHGVPPGLIDLVLQCLDKDRDRRPADANAIVESMIDVVNAPLFRLPYASTSSGARAFASPERTGMLDLEGFDPSAPHATIAGPPPAPVDARAPLRRAQRTTAAVVATALVLLASLSAAVVVTSQRELDVAAAPVAADIEPPLVSPAAIVVPIPATAPIVAPAAVPPAPPATPPTPTPTVALEPVSSDLAPAITTGRRSKRGRGAVAASAPVPSEPTDAHPEREPLAPATTATPRERPFLSADAADRSRDRVFLSTDDTPRGAQLLDRPQ